MKRATLLQSMLESVESEAWSGFSCVDVQTISLSQSPPLPQHTLSSISSSFVQSRWSISAHIASAASNGILCSPHGRAFSGVIHVFPSIAQQRAQASYDLGWNEPS